MWQVAKATIIRNQTDNLRAYPWSFTFGHMINGLYIVLVSYFAYTYLIKGELDHRFVQFTGSNDYLTFAIIGGVLSTLSVTMMMNVSRALITEWREGTLEVILLAPASRWGYFLGTAIQQLYRMMLVFIPVTLIGFWLGLRTPLADWLSVGIGIVLFFLSCFSMAMVLGAIMLYTRDTYIVQNTLFSILALVCGFQFPVQYLPLPLQWLGEIFPLTSSLDMLRDSLLTGGLVWEQPERIVTNLILCVVYTLVGFFMNRQVERTVFERHMA